MSKQPLTVLFVWHHSDNETVKEAIDFCFKKLKRDSKYPFSRAINLPVFFRTSDSVEVPSRIDYEAEKILIFVFISKYLLASEKWTRYVNDLLDNEKHIVLPIAVDSLAFNINSPLKSHNFIRAYNFEQEFYKENLLISVAHEIYRKGLSDEGSELKLGVDSSIKLFISHAKDGSQGIAIAKELKFFIDNTSMSNFFDATDIAPGYRFDKEIEDHIAISTLIAIHSDIYSSRYWCQREIICAKKQECPIVAVDCLEEFEDRRFPLASNIPSTHLHLNTEKQVEKSDLYRIVSLALLETIRFKYSKITLNLHKIHNSDLTEAVVLGRPPELINFNKDQRENNQTFLYPEPPLYEDELKIFLEMGINAYTPLNLPNNESLVKKIGISISDPSKQDLMSIGQNDSHLVQLSQDIARNLLIRKHTLIYGGDLRENGFTDFIFQEAQILQSRYSNEHFYLKNYIAWPIYKADDEKMINWKAQHNKIAKMIEVSPAENVKKWIKSPDVFLPPSNVENQYVWSNCLTKMRKEMIEDCDIRICAGGKHSGYKGKMPGVLEEILIAIDMKKPLFLLGGFGGVTQSVVETILEQNIPIKLTEDWQVNNNEGYESLLELYKKESTDRPNYSNMQNCLNMTVFNNGLCVEDNKELLETPYLDVAVRLILKGLSQLSHK